jgi:intermediate cleaving peptidase 55
MPTPLIIEKDDSTSKGYKMTLFATGSTPEKEKWDGPRTPLSELCGIFGADEAHPFSEFSTHLRSMTRKGGSSDEIYIDLPKSPSFSFAMKRIGRSTRTSSKLSGGITKHLSSAIRGEKENWKRWEEYLSIYDAAGIDPNNVQPLGPIVGKLRAIKSEAEIEVMRNAGEISGRAHAKVCSFILRNE